MTRYHYLGLLAALIMIICALPFDAVSDSRQDEKTYCEMVSQWKLSDGRHGWPDYRGMFNEVCEHEPH